MILWRNIEIFLSFFILIPTPDFLHFYYMLGGNLRSLLYGDVSVMKIARLDYMGFYRLETPWYSVDCFRSDVLSNLI